MPKRRLSKTPPYRTEFRMLIKGFLLTSSLSSSHSLSHLSQSDTHTRYHRSFAAILISSLDQENSVIPFPVFTHHSLWYVNMTVCTWACASAYVKEQKRWRGVYLYSIWKCVRVCVFVRALLAKPWQWVKIWMSKHLSVVLACIVILHVCYQWSWFQLKKKTPIKTSRCVAWIFPSSPYYAVVSSSFVFFNSTLSEYPKEVFSIINSLFSLCCFWVLISNNFTCISPPNTEAKKDTFMDQCCHNILGYFSLFPLSHFPLKHHNGILI